MDLPHRPAHVQTKTEIAALLADVGLRPRKRFGQHFLIDGNLMRRLVSTAELQPGDAVIEVGAGTGGLTDLLVTGGRRILCVEVDRDLFPLLERRFGDEPAVTLLNVDCLESKHRIHPDVDGWLRAQIDTRVILVSNLPYHAATPLLMNLLTDYPKVERLVFTVQAEVGDRLMAAPNTKAYGPLSIVAQLLARIVSVVRIPPQAFWPRPGVDSVMLRVDRIVSPFTSSDELKRFAAFVRGVFDHRRKTLRSALGYVVEKDVCARIAECFDANRRPEALTKEEWLKVFAMADP
jgi:16S rRNA (adenine1518-N6/adenine1519-N6)-dimethyltransferase